MATFSMRRSPPVKGTLEAASGSEQAVRATSLKSSTHAATRHPFAGNPNPSKSLDLSVPNCSTPAPGTSDFSDLRRVALLFREGRCPPGCPSRDSFWAFSDAP